MENLTEMIVPKKMGWMEMLMRGAMIAVCLLVPMTIPLLGRYGIYVLVVEFFVIYGTVLIFRYTNVEYEYSYMGGVLAIIKIMGQSKRKILLNVDMTKVERIAPENSEEIGYYAKNPSVSRTDYTGGFAQEEPVYLVVYAGETGPELIEFVPDRKMLEKMQKEYPGKVYIA